jgi:hypothetical protein
LVCVLAMTYLRTGSCMVNRLRMAHAAGAGAAIDAGETVTIGTDVYEFNAATPPAAGTAGMVWVYQGATVAASRTNLTDAINGVVDAARINRTSYTNVQKYYCRQGVDARDLIIVSATAVGGYPTPSNSATATTSTLSDPGDLWDNAVVYGGEIRKGGDLVAAYPIIVTANMIAKGSVECNFPFNPAGSMVFNPLRPQDEALVLCNLGGNLATFSGGTSLSLTLNGGVSPNNQPGDAITFAAGRHIPVPDPAAIFGAGLAAWWRSDYGITKDGANLVDTWLDKGAGGKDATAAGAARPLFVANQINGWGAVRFAGLTSVLSIIDTPFTNSVSVMIVMKPSLNNDRNANTLFAFAGTVYLKSGLSAGVLGNRQAIYTQGPPIVQKSHTVSSQLWSSWLFEFDSTGMAIGMNNNVPEIGGAGTVLAQNWSKFGFVGFGFDGDVVEVVAATRATVIQRAALLGYASDRYRIW